MFQFHNGPIKSYNRIFHIKYVMCFNFTMVRLKDRQIAGYIDRSKSFNSTMVRLKALGGQKEGRRFRGFNSTMVRLKESGQ